MDTAAARLKRHYQFVSNDEMNTVRKNKIDGDLVASTMVEEGQEWEAMPGSYYKMGSDWGDQDDHLTIEVEKMGQEVDFILPIVHHHKKDWQVIAFSS